MPTFSISIGQARYTKIEATANDAGFVGPDAVKLLVLSLLKDFHVNQTIMKEHGKRDAAIEAARAAAQADVDNL